MSSITLKGTPIHTSGELPKTGTHAPDFLLTKTDLSDVSLQTYAGKTVILNIFPSIDTPVCAASVRKFNQEVSAIPDTAVLCVSRDLPFALKRFCGAENLNNVIPVSELRNQDFGYRYGLRITDGPLAGLIARAVVIINKKGIIIYTQLVPEIAQEPDYNSAITAAKQ